VLLLCFFVIGVTKYFIGGAPFFYPISFSHKRVYTTVSLWVLVIVSLIALPVYLTGEPSEEMVEDLAGVSESIIEQHEDIALISLIAVILLGVTATVGLFFFRHSATIPGWFIAISLIISIIAGGLMGKTANLGGQIRHSEIRKDFQLSITDVNGC
jgi:hypothetical protein